MVKPETAIKVTNMLILHIAMLTLMGLGLYVVVKTLVKAVKDKFHK